jgi:dolichol-phosphate mannosyltransferase
MFVLLFVGGSLMITLGFIGIYIGYIFQEVKGRPIYLVRQKDAGHGQTESIGGKELEGLDRSEKK